MSDRVTPDLMTMTIKEIEALLDQYFDDTGRWDPMVNGKLDKELEGLDPNEPGLSVEEHTEIVRQRGEIYERYEQEHHIMVGQRMATRSLGYRFQKAEEDWRQAKIDAEPWTGLRPCCEVYLRSLAYWDGEWAREASEWRDGPPPYKDKHLTPAGHIAILEECIADNTDLRAKIETGTYAVNERRRCCPWDDRVDHGSFHSSYVALDRFWQKGGSMEDLTFGPIEVIPGRHPR